MTNDDCVTHDLKYVLGRDSKFDSTVVTQKKAGFTCNQCRFPFYTCHKIKNLITHYTTPNQSNNTSHIESTLDVLAKIKNASMVIDECEKSLNYLWHIVLAAQIKTLPLMIYTVE